MRGRRASAWLNCLRRSVYGANHSVVVYKTDLKTWDYKGVALSADARRSGTEFRPCVVYNALTKMYVMWYEDRRPDQQGCGCSRNLSRCAPPIHLTGI